MARDSLYGERIVWTGRPKSVRPSALLRALSGLCFATSLISLLFALVTSLVLQLTPTGTVLFAFWTTTLGIALRTVPRMVMERARYVVTEHRVVVQFGPFRRSIQRSAVSFARIYWDADQPDTGDLELVRAVPTGALRRRLLLRLPGIAAPDRVWAIVRGAEDLAPLGSAEMPITQRLDRGERVIWSAQPRQQLRAFLPHGQRQWLLMAISGCLVFVGLEMIFRAFSTLAKVARGGLPYLSPMFVALATGIFLAVAVVLVIGGYIAYDTIIRPGKLISDTRYLITDKRVLIQRRGEELHLDRSKIVDVIDAPAGGDGLRNVFIVLDGPQARSLAASGAFGELDRSPHLRPVFEAVEDAEGARRVLGSSPVLPYAA
ncbi:MAG TPA: hypothetical protein VIW29_08475 [Polyangiaceae bacterium]